MSIEDNTRIVQNIHPLWNNREFDRILSEMIDEDIEWTTVPTGETFRGHEGFRQFMQGWVDAFPDGKTEDTTIYAGINSESPSTLVGQPTTAPSRAPLEKSRRRGGRWSSSCARYTSLGMAR